MNNNKKFNLATAATMSAAALFAAAPASAGSLDFTGGANFGTCDGAITCTVNGFTLTAGETGDSPFSGDGATLAEKEVNGVYGLGVQHSPGGSNGGGSQLEVDRYETLSIDFKESIVKSLDLVFLYEAGPNTTHFGDALNEVASVVAGGFTGTLTVLDELTAEWSWNGITQTVSAKSNADGTGGGWFSISNPFDDVKVSSVELLAEPGEPANPLLTGERSDYSLGGIATVPEPTAVIGLGALALSAFGLRKGKESAA